PAKMLTTEPKGSDVLTGDDGNPVKRSLFAPFLKAELNEEEQGVAIMLDGNAAISWWHRNVAMANAGYGLQGWKRGRIYPDFIFSAQGTGKARRLVALETKGDHLQNPDTDYKRDLLAFLSNNFDWENAVPAGQLKLENTGETVECALILMADIKTKLPDFLK
ncbi:MAG: type III restriction endonuclease subunit R, partial [Marinosulfonomonas sp.]